MSTPINDGGPAFPWHSDGCYPDEPPSTGMSLRDYFAAKIVAGWLASYTNIDVPLGELDYESIADDAYTVADAMLATREAK